MRECLRIALLGVGKVDPNPLVGAALVDKQGIILKKAHHKEAGTPHAEVNLLADVERIAETDTVFVTLEPCNHHGKTPACTEFLLAKGVKNLVIGGTDPNPQMNGKSIRYLRDCGVKVRTGVLEEECNRLNRVFRHHIVKKTPYIALKAAITLDGKIATKFGASKWITNEASRKQVHRYRAFYRSVAVGSGTLITDNPMLNCRLKNPPAQPTRIFFDGSAKISPDLSGIQSNHSPKILIADPTRADFARIKQLENAGIEVLLLKTGTQICEALLKELYRRGIVSMMVEGGQALLTSFIDSNLFQALHLFMAPKLIGGEGIGWCGGLNILQPEQIKHLRLQSLKKHQNNIELFLTNPS